MLLRRSKITQDTRARPGVRLRSINSTCAQLSIELFRIAHHYRGAMEHRIVQIGAYEFAVESETRHGKVRGKRTVSGFVSPYEAQSWLEAQLALPEPGTASPERELATQS